MAGTIRRRGAKGILDEQSIQKYITEVAKKAGALMSPSTPSGWKMIRSRIHNKNN